MLNQNNPVMIALETDSAQSRAVLRRALYFIKESPDNFEITKGVKNALISWVDPQVIIAAGNASMHTLLGTELPSVVHPNKPTRGYVFKDFVERKPRYVVPTYDLKYIMQGKANLLPVLFNDINKALKVNTGGYTQPRTAYIEKPSIAEMKAFVREAAQGQRKWLACDIETPHSGFKPEDELDNLHDIEIDRVSFAIAPGRAITVPFTELRYRKFVQEMLLIPYQFITFWNADFDVPRLKAQGLEFISDIHDSMWMWHFLQSSLPKALAFVTPLYLDYPEWKSESVTRPEYYSCVDSDVTLQLAMGIAADLQREQRWHIYMDHVHRLLPVLRTVGQHGFVKDREQTRRMVTELTAEIASVHSALLAEIPDECKPRTYRKVMKIKVRCPRCCGMGWEPDKAALKAMKRTLKSLAEHPLQSKDYPATDEKCTQCNGTRTAMRNLTAAEASKGATMLDFESDGKYWVRVDEWNPNSPVHIIDYIRAKGYRVPTHYKTKAATTNEAEIRKLARRHPDDVVLNTLLSYRKSTNQLTKYVLGYPPDDVDDRVRTTFTLKPSTHRLASQDPAMQQFPKRPNNEVSAERLRNLRNMFIAAPDHKLVAIDYNAIEAVLVGWYADDPEYIRASQLGIHAIFASHLLANQGKLPEPIDMSWNEDEIRVMVANIKAEEKRIYNVAKICDLALNYLATPKKLYEEDTELLGSQKFVKEVAELYFNTIARKVREWQRNTLREAERKHYLDNAFGYRHYFWDVLGKGKLGSQAKDCIAYRPQSTAAGIIKRAMLAIAETPDLLSMLMLQVHDELLFEIPVSVLDESIKRIVDIMGRPIPEMDNLTIGLEVEIGDRWGEMEKYD